MLNREIKQNPLWEKSKHKLLHYLQSSAFILMSIDACVCLFVIWYYCSPGMCADVFPEESQFNWVYAAFVVGVHVVSATPLEDRIYVTCSYVFVFCHVSKSFLFFFLYNSFSSSSSTAAGTSGGLRCEQAMSADAEPSSQSLLSGQKGRSSVPLVQRPPCSHLRVSGRGGRWHLGNTCLFIFFLCWKAPDETKTLSFNTDGIHGW